MPVPEILLDMRGGAAGATFGEEEDCDKWMDRAIHVVGGSLLSGMQAAGWGYRSTRTLSSSSSNCSSASALKAMQPACVRLRPQQQ